MSSLSYSVDSSAGIVTLVYHSQPTFEEWGGAMDRIMRDRAFRPGYSIILDRTAVNDSPDAVYIQRMVDHVRRRIFELGDVWIAVVVGGPADYTAARSAQGLLHEIPMGIFTNMQKARSWLLTRRRGVRLA